MSHKKESVPVQAYVPMYVVFMVLAYALMVILVPFIELPLFYLDQKNAIDDMLEQQKKYMQSYGPQAFQDAMIFTPGGEVNTTIVGSTSVLLEEFSQDVEKLLDKETTPNYQLQKEYV